MITRRSGAALLAILSLLLLLTGLAQAQGPGPAEGGAKVSDLTVAEEATADLAEEPLEVAGVSAAMSDIIPFQGRLTNAAGVPLNGSYSIRLALYDVASGGTALCSDTDTVAVTNGLFTFNMNFCAADDIDGKQLYLGVKVGADAEMTPRQAVYPVPFARSLRPGAIINQTGTADHALTVKSAGSGEAGAALLAQNTHATGGIGVWAQAGGNDAAIVSKNTGSGPLIKGFGNDGGEDEFRVNNNGSIESKADSYIFVPGAALVKNLSADTTRWDIQANGAARIWRGSAAGSKYVYYPLVIPTQLYGRAVKVESVTIYYLVADGTKGYITYTDLRKPTDADSYITLFSDTTNRTSTTASSYTLIPTSNNVLSANEGLVLMFYLYFADDTNWVQIGGIRIQLGHHSLY